ncbi:MAG TPA: adenylate/guanylate cyclase domain-containing protein, partial [Chloroflexia bacterium]|nr:adenylate/guanylate cyclase domain-containing protein [Chloroflexia bacterium]
MDWLFVSAPAISALPDLLLAAAMAGYLLAARIASPARRYLGTYFALEAALGLAAAGHAAVYAPWGAYLGLLESSLLLLQLAVLVQFAYAFPGPRYPREARWVGGLVLAGVLLFVLRDLIPAGLSAPVFNAAAGQYDLRDPLGLPAPLPQFMALLDSLRPPFTYLLYLLSVGVLLRQTLAAAEAADGRSSWQKLRAPRTRGAQGARLFAGVALGAALCTASAEWLPPDLGELVGLGVVLLFALVYLNSAPEPASFRVKLVGATLVTVLVVLGLGNLQTLALADTAYDRERAAEVRQVGLLIPGQQWAALPPTVAYIATAPPAGAAGGTLIYSRDRLAAPPAGGAAGPGRGYRQLGPGQDYLTYSLVVAGVPYEVGYAYTAYRQAIQATAGFLALLLLGTTAAILGLLPLFFQTGLVAPLTALQAGIRQVQAGRLDVVVPVRFEDEIGFLTRAFNGMVGALQTATADLATQNAVLAQTNQAATRFVPTELLRLLGRESLLDVQLGDGVQLEMTVLFADIRDFTSLAEHMTPAENFAFINAYLRRISPVIRDHGGFIDKYIGDAIMALFPGSADSALRAALAMHHALAAYNAERRSTGSPPIAIGIALHTGLLMLGTVGEAARLEATVISDVVNTAARLESLTKDYQAGIILSAQTRARLADPTAYPLHALGTVQV